LSKALDIKRLSNREFAEIIGVHESQISNWINGRSTPYKRTQRKIISALGVSILEKEEGWVVDASSDSQKIEEVAYADEVELPADGQISKDLMKELLGQIESIARILKDSL